MTDGLACPSAGGAPVALFTFKRPEHTQRVLESLARNPGFDACELHVFCDAARRPDEAVAVERTREAVRAFAHPRKHVTEAAGNQGLAKSIVSAVGALCRSHGRVIVLEDDLVVAPGFLDFMNRALNRYAVDPSVMQVSGHMFPIANPGADAVLLPMTTSWGWATWERAWAGFDPRAGGAERLRRSLRERHRFDLDGSYPYYSMLKDQLSGRIDSWAIRWYLSVFLANGRGLFPARSLVDNTGFDGSGTHCMPDEAANTPAMLADRPLGEEASSPQADVRAMVDIKRYLRRQRGGLRLIQDWRQRLFAA